MTQDGNIIELELVGIENFDLGIKDVFGNPSIPDFYFYSNENKEHFQKMNKLCNDFVVQNMDSFSAGHIEFDFKVGFKDIKSTNPNMNILPKYIFSIDLSKALNVEDCGSDLFDKQYLLDKNKDNLSIRNPNFEFDLNNSIDIYNPYIFTDTKYNLQTKIESPFYLYENVAACENYNYKISWEKKSFKVFACNGPELASSRYLISNSDGFVYFEHGASQKGIFLAK